MFLISSTKERIDMQLHYRVFGDFGEDVIILHGLLGSLDNWQSEARKLSEAYRVWIVDLRNHGRSPHTDDMSYELMTEDVKEFMEQHDIAQAHIVGHSMGGKVAMTFALTYPERVDQLVVVDIGPKPYVGDHLPYLEAMLNTDTSKYSSRSEIEEKIKEQIRSEWVVQVIMKNLGRDENKQLQWRPHVSLLKRVYQDIMGSSLPNTTFEGRTDFIKGSESDYIQEEEFDSFKEYFPQAKLHLVQGAGHIVHTEQPEAFYEVLIQILGE